MQKIDRKKFFDGVRQSPFPRKLKQTQVDGCNVILDEAENRNDMREEFLAYILATVFWETDNTMQPIKEAGGEKYLRSKKYYPYYGRGYVQLTWKQNYLRMGQILSSKFGMVWHAFADNPDIVLRPDISCAILFEGMLRAESFKGDFTGKSLSDYFDDNKTDWIGARRIINGTDRANEIAAIAKQFHSDILMAM